MAGLKDINKRKFGVYAGFFMPFITVAAIFLFRSGTTSKMIAGAIAAVGALIFFGAKEELIPRFFPKFERWLEHRPVRDIETRETEEVRDMARKLGGLDEKVQQDKSRLRRFIEVMGREMRAYMRVMKRKLPSARDAEYVAQMNKVMKELQDELAKPESKLLGIMEEAERTAVKTLKEIQEEHKIVDELVKKRRKVVADTSKLERILERYIDDYSKRKETSMKLRAEMKVAKGRGSPEYQRALAKFEKNLEGMRKIEHELGMLKESGAELRLNKEMGRNEKLAQAVADLERHSSRVVADIKETRTRILKGVGFEEGKKGISKIERMLRKMGFIGEKEKLEQMKEEVVEQIPVIRRLSELEKHVGMVDAQLKDEFASFVPVHKERSEAIHSKFVTLKDLVQWVVASAFEEDMELLIAQEKIAQAQADKASMIIASLENNLRESEQESGDFELKVAALEGGLKDTSEALSRWNHDLANARKIAKEKGLDQVLADQLNENVMKATTLLTDLTAVLVAKNDFAASEKRRADSAELQLAATAGQVMALTDEKEALEKNLEKAKAAKESFEDLNREIHERAEDLEKENIELEKDKESNRSTIEENRVSIQNMKLDLEANAREIIRLDAENTRLEETLKTVDSMRLKAIRDHDIIEAEAKKLKQKEQVISESLEETDRQLRLVSKEKDKLESELDHKRKEWEDKVTSDKAKDLKDAAEKREMETRVAEARRELEKKREELAEALESKEDLANKNKEIIERKKAVERAELHHETENKRLARRLSAKEAALEKQKAEAESWKERYEKEIDPLKDGVSSLEEQNNRLQHRNIELESQLRAISAERQDIAGIPEDQRDSLDDEKLEQLRRQETEMQAALESSQERQRLLESELKETKARLAEAEEHEKSLREYIEGREAELQASIAELEELVASATARSEDSMHKADEAEGRARAAGMRIDELEAQIGNQHTAIEDLTTQLAVASQRGDQAGALADVINQRDIEIEGLRTKEAQLMKAVTEIREELDESELKRSEEAAAAKEAIEGLEAERDGLGERLQETVSESEELRLEIEKLERTDIPELQKKLADARSKAKKVPGLEAQEQKISAELSDKQTLLKTSNEELTRVLEENRQLHEQDQQRVQQIRELQRRLEEAEKQKDKDAQEAEKQRLYEEWLKIIQPLTAKFHEMRRVGYHDFDEATRLLIEIKESVATAKKEKLWLDDQQKKDLNDVAMVAEREYNTIKAYLEQQGQAKQQQHGQGVFRKGTAPAIPPDDEDTQVTQVQKVEDLLPKETPRVIAIGDLHGDHKRFRFLMESAGIIDSSNRWKLDKDTTVVMLGDYIDRGEGSFKILRDLYNLKQHAGDRLRLLIGNHEGMFLGAFDWEGYDETPRGREVLQWYLKRRSALEQVLIQKLQAKGIQLNINEKGNIPTALFTRASQGQGQVLAIWEQVIRDSQFRDIAELYIRLEIGKMSWVNNDKLETLFVLKVDINDLFHNTKKLVHQPIEGTDVAGFIRFMRDTLETFYYDKKTNVMFLHAGVPYDSTNSESIDFNLPHHFKGYIYGRKLKKILKQISDGIRHRNVLNWMFYSEKTPLFACHPMNRKKEWNTIPEFNEDMVKSTFGFNAVVFGHSYHVTPEAELQKIYSSKPRRVFNIDFALSSAYDLDELGESHGGWVEIYDDGKAVVKRIDKKDNITSHDYYTDKVPAKKQQAAQQTKLV